MLGSWLSPLTPAARPQGLRKLRTAGLVVRRGLGGRVDPYRYMIKAAFARLSPEAQCAPPPPEDDELMVDSDSASPADVADEDTSGDIAAAAPKAADDVIGLDMAPCGVEPLLPEESAASSLDAPSLPAVLASMPAPTLAAWRAVAVAV